MLAFMIGLMVGEAVTLVVAILIMGRDDDEP